MNRLSQKVGKKQSTTTSVNPDNKGLAPEEKDKVPIGVVNTTSVGTESKAPASALPPKVEDDSQPLKDKGGDVVMSILGGLVTAGLAYLGYKVIIKGK